MFLSFSSLFFLSLFTLSRSVSLSLSRSSYSRFVTVVVLIVLVVRARASSADSSCFLLKDSNLLFEKSGHIFLKKLFRVSQGKVEKNQPFWKIDSLLFLSRDDDDDDGALKNSRRTFSPSRLPLPQRLLVEEYL